MCVLNTDGRVGTAYMVIRYKVSMLLRLTHRECDMGRDESQATS